MLSAVKRVLGRTFEVLTATSAEEALAVVASRPLDLLITDLRMPGTSGIELVERVRARSCPMPVMVVTASPDDVAVQSALRARLVQAIVAKPWSSTYLVGQVLELIQAKVDRTQSD